MLTVLMLASVCAAEPFPLSDPLRVLEQDTTNPVYRDLVLTKMLSTDLAAEWQRVATVDNADAFLKAHGGLEKVNADPVLKAAYDRRVKVRDDFLTLMREGFARFKKKAPFDTGAIAETGGVVATVKPIASSKFKLGDVPTGAEGQWHRFRGTDGQGGASAEKPPTLWNKAGKNVAWTTPIAGAGNSSPIVWGKSIFLTASDKNGTERSLLAFDLDTGKELWKHSDSVPAKEAGVRDKNGYASATPTTDGERVYAFLGNLGVVCCDMNGKQLWKYADFIVKTTHGPGASPLLDGDLLILCQDQNQSESIFLALDKRTGKPVWQQKRGKAMTWNTPIVVRVDDHNELIIAGGKTIRGYDPKTGKELWIINGPTEEVVPTVVVGPKFLYSASGRNGPTIAFRPGGTGNVTETHVAWRFVRGGPHVPSPVLVGDRLYTVNDTGIVTNLNADTGELIYQERISDRFSASPVSAGGLLYCCSESGVTYLLKPGDTFEVVHKNDLGSPILASPAFVGNTMLLRTEAGLTCIKER